MTPLSRRRFLTLTAASLVPLPAQARQMSQWHGTALGAEAAIYLVHPDADAIIGRAVAEIDRLENVFSLYRAASSISQLNATGRLQAPPFELLECLSLCGRVNAASQGLFDPTVQPLWRLYATSFAAGSPPTKAQIVETLPLIGWQRVNYDSTAVQLIAGTELTLNGIAQGFVADKVAELLASEGLGDILVNSGEFRAMGQMPGAQGWPVELASGGKVSLLMRALATSSPLGTVFDTEGVVGHILDPINGMTAPAVWKSVTISARTAALADAVSTAACLMPDRTSMEMLLSNFPEARIEALA